MIRRYLIWRNRHADDQLLCTFVERAKVAGCGTRYHSCSGQMGFFAQGFTFTHARHAAACRAM